MTEKTFIVLFICVTVIFVASILADCYKTALKTKEKRRASLESFEPIGIQMPEKKPPRSGSSLMRRGETEVGSKEWMKNN